MTYSAPRWLQQAIFYQIFPERFSNGNPRNDPSGSLPWGGKPSYDNFFGGDLQGILDHLPYLQDLGITALYLTPIFKARTNHKYDACDYLQIDPAFGDLNLLRRLVDDAHRRGIRVVLDAVFNHCGDGFWAFEDLRQNGSQSKYTDWFFPKGFPIQQDPPNYQTCGGAVYLPKLNTANPEVRDYLLKVAVYWIREAGIDGWRLDVPWKVPLDFWREFHQVVRQANPEACIIGEAWRDPSPWLAGDVCDGIMNYPLRDMILDYCVRDTMDAEDFDYFTRRLVADYGPAAPFQLNLLGSHDTARILSVCRGDQKRLALALTAQFTSTGTPMIYYGDETGMEGENDPDCRRCMDWDPAHWKESLVQITRELIRCRHEHPALSSGSQETLLLFNGVYAFRKALDGDEVLVILNPRQAQHGLSIPCRSSYSHWKDLFSGQEVTLNSTGLFLETLPEKTALILLPDGTKTA